MIDSRLEVSSEGQTELSRAAGAFGIISTITSMLGDAVNLDQTVDCCAEAGRGADGKFRKRPDGKLDGSCRIVIDIGPRPG
jgi:hypothetical protein